MTEVLEDEIQKKTEQLENIKIAGQRLTPGYIKQNTFTAISSGKYKPILFLKLIFISIIKSFVSFVNCLCVCAIFILSVIMGLCFLNDCFYVLISCSYCCMQNKLFGKFMMKRPNIKKLFLVFVLDPNPIPWQLGAGVEFLLTDIIMNFQEHINPTWTPGYRKRKDIKSEIIDICFHEE